MPRHKVVVQRQFTRTVDAFSKTAVRDTPEIAAERVAFARPQPDDLVLDVGCGPGIFVLAIAPHVRYARGIDLTQAMLVRAREFQQERQITNACFVQGEAERLPYPDTAFNLVSSHFAFHHLLKPEAVLREMLRVTKPEGRLMVVDTLGPESDEKWELHNQIENLRDPSHIASLRLTTFLNFFDDLELEIIRQTQKRRQRSFNQWMQRAGLAPPSARYFEIRRLIEEAIPGDKASFGAQRQSDDLIITHIEGMFLLRRKSTE
jgi:ubiquinone/menaquinone biosynthesis C-methylase UbiE